MWSAANDLRLSPLLSANELQRQFSYRAANKTTDPQTNKKEKAAAATAPLANVYACVIVWMLNITAGVANSAYVLLYAMRWKCKTKQNKTKM